FLGIQAVAAPEFLAGGGVMPGQAIAPDDEDLSLAVRADVRDRRGVALLGFLLRLRGPRHFPNRLPRRWLEREQVALALFGVAHLAVSLVHVAGRPVSDEVPLKAGPRHCGQFSA